MKNKNTWTKTNTQQITQCNTYQSGPPQGTNGYRQRSGPTKYTQTLSKGCMELLN